MIAVFGASVTQQKTGYSVQLSSKLNKRVQIFGYGGMHLNDAGICFIDKVLEIKPLYCFVDWFSTAYKDTNKETIEYLDTIIYKFTKSQCKLVFLFFPRKDDMEREEFYLFCKKHLEKKKIFYIDLRSEIEDTDIDRILRDTVHTTDYGSNIYSEIIADRFKRAEKDIGLISMIKSTKYSYINKISVEKVFDKVIRLTGECKIIGFYLTIGPHSGIVEVNDGKHIQIYNTWDRWCNFSRKHFFLSFAVNGIIQINILEDEFDTSVCKEKYNFEKERKKLLVHEIYYVGEYLEITNISSGKSISKMYLFFHKNLERVNRYKKLFQNKLLTS